MVKGQKRPHSFIITEKLILGQYKYYFSNNADLRYFVHNCQFDLSYTTARRLPLPAKIFNFIKKMESDLKSYTHFSESGLKSGIQNVILSFCHRQGHRVFFFQKTLLIIFSLRYNCPSLYQQKGPRN